MIVITCNTNEEFCIYRGGGGGGGGEREKREQVWQSSEVFTIFSESRIRKSDLYMPGRTKVGRMSFDQFYLMSRCVLDVWVFPVSARYWTSVRVGKASYKGSQSGTR